jgi:hypothetical protein
MTGNPCISLTSPVAVDHAVANAEKLGLVLNDPVFTVHLCHEVEPFPVVWIRSSNVPSALHDR